METKNEAALRLSVGLNAELERDIRSKINPQYEFTPGTESYERKQLISEIDRLRAVFKIKQDELDIAEERFGVELIRVHYKYVDNARNCPVLKKVCAWENGDEGFIPDVPDAVLSGKPPRTEL